MKKFEYKTVENENLSELELNDYGNEGWQLISVISVTTNYEVLENLQSFNYYFIKEQN